MYVSIYLYTCTGLICALCCFIVTAHLAECFAFWFSSNWRTSLKSNKWFVFWRLPSTFDRGQRLGYTVVAAAVKVIVLLQQLLLGYSIAAAAVVRLCCCCSNCCWDEILWTCVGAFLKLFCLCFMELWVSFTQQFIVFHCCYCLVETLSAIFLTAC